MIPLTRNVRRLAALGFALVATASWAAAPPPAAPAVPDLARSRAWLRLLHYHRPFPWFTVRSELVGPDFFLASDGRTDPEAELRADIRAFADPERRVGWLRQPAQCAFPVRYRFLKAALSLSTPDVPCPEYAEYLGRFRAHSATLVFSSAYPSSPASMFGHTFLRINATSPAVGRKLDLLDYGISYAAVVPPHENSFAYAYLGLMGGYPGQFSIEPYYMKVREYTDGESRDLWEYDLGLNEEETVRLVSHVWEIVSTSGFYYYFATENCSYQLLALLEAVRPEWELTGHFIHVIPAETVKKLVATPGAVTGVHYRPALRKRVLGGYAALTADEREVFGRLIDGRQAPAAVSSAAALDVAIEYAHYRKESQDGRLDEPTQHLLTESLLRRSMLADAPRALPDDADSQADSRPERGHLPYRVGISGGVESSDSTAAAALGYVDLNLKVAYHDLLNDDRGYSRFSQIDFPSLTLRFRPVDHRLGLEQLLIGSLTSLNPFNLIDHKISWHVQADYYAAKDFGCLDCHLLRAEGGVGPTWNLFSHDAVLTALLYGYAEAGESLDGSVRGGPGAELATIVNPVTPYKTRLAVRAVTDPFTSARPWIYYRLAWEHSLRLDPGHELRASVLRYFHGAPSRDYGEAQLSLNFYF